MKTEEIFDGTLDTWTPQEVAEAYARHEIYLIDVRTPAEYMFEHVDGAMLAPMSFVRISNIPDNDRRPVVFYCGSGVRSKRVAAMYIEAGHSRAAHMEGGFAAWKASGLPYIGTNMATGAPESRGG
ncbi:MAG: rhodanese-like domain-containing protein [Oricola sp.]